MKPAHLLAALLATATLGLAAAAPAGATRDVEVVEADPDQRARVCATSEVGKTYRRQEAVVDESCSNGGEICRKIMVYRDWTVASKSRDGRVCQWKEGRRRFSVIDCEPRPAGFDGRTCLSVGQQYLIQGR